MMIAAEPIGSRQERPWRGATGTRIMGNGMVVSVFVINVPVLLHLEHNFGKHGMWAADLFLFASRSLTLGWFLLKLWRRPDYKLR